jgi:[citrate (pro-3S)-lyase] ligase
MVPAALPLLTSRDRDGARRLVESQGLAFEDGCDDVVGIHDEGRLVATAARAGYVLEMFAIDEAWQGGETLGRLVTALVELGSRAGHDSLFVYTRPAYAASFEACNFKLLVECGAAALLEFGGGIERYLRACRAGVPAAEGKADTGRLDTGRLDARGASVPAADTAARGLDGRGAPGALPATRGAIVLNGNPFTRGHQYLVETAAARVDWLYLFVVREERSAFPFAARLEMARRGVAHLPNVAVLDTSRYAVSAGTFPSYFLRRHDEAARVQMEVDARLFGARLAPGLAVGRRFVGDEPYCEATRAYNAVLSRVLPEYGVALDVVPRAGDETGYFSATRVRAALAADDWQTVERLVPPTTLALLRDEKSGWAPA